MEAKGLRAAAVTGCAGVERLRLELPRPGRARRHHPDGRAPGRGLAAAEAALAIERIGRGRGRRGDDGRAAPRARDRDGGRRAGGARRSTSATPRPSRWRGCSRRPAAAAPRPRPGAAARLADEPIWRIEPIPFDPGLVAAARTACAAAAGEPASLASGALHDAAEVARVLPAAMVFAPSTGGHQPRPGGGHPGGRPRGRDRGVRCARGAPPRARHLVPPANRSLGGFSHVACRT